MAGDRAPFEPVLRLRLYVRGQVQGVGFRPFVHRLAAGFGLAGWVRNDGGGVEMEIEGDCAHVRQFVDKLHTDAPPAARIELLEQCNIAALGESAFEIRASAAGPASTAISPDSAICSACLAEMFDPANRRYRHPFIHCVHCGPRYTISARLPYDRANTSMAAFEECRVCSAERESPGDRRFHAQTNACYHCGPQLRLIDSERSAIAGDPIAAALTLLRQGAIIAIKGMGGFHLACDATNADAVHRLRDRKAREEKPFAVMAANVASLQSYAQFTRDEAVLLGSPQRPIVLLQKHSDSETRLHGVSPGLSTLGAMLPSTPIQYLLFHEAAGRPDGVAWLDAPQSLLLVMTSANPHGDPLVIDNDCAMRELAHIADAFLLHDRDILIRCDDSVIRPGAQKPQFLRRARGYVPTTIALPVGPPGFAAGAYLNNTICVVRGGEAFMSQHIGDLDTRAACVAFDSTVAHLLDILQVQPAWVACDLHPDFHSTRFARAFAAQQDLPLIEVQHHHAHIAAVMAEHSLDKPVLGLALDGFGLGDDGQAWGGELLRVDGAQCTRLGHLRPLPLPGGDRAAREPWRMAAAALFEAGMREEIISRFGSRAAIITTMLEKGLNTPRTSSAGRLFDAAAGLLGVRETTSYEGQAAAMLEGLADAFGDVAAMPGGYEISKGVLDLRPLLAHLAHMQDAAQAAAIFHATFADALAAWTYRAASEQGIEDIVFGGGCFINRLLSARLRKQLEAHGLRVHEAERVPPGDGGLALGQAWIALQTLK